MGMEWSSWKMIQQAKEELEILEAQHPNRFDYLKLELKSFIFLHESHHLMLPQNINMPSSSTATTQESSSRKRKKGDSGIQKTMVGRKEASKHKFQMIDKDTRRRDRVDFVLERAQSCLRKIRELKSTLY